MPTVPGIARFMIGGKPKQRRCRRAGDLQVQRTSGLPAENEVGIAPAYRFGAAIVPSRPF